MLLLLLDMLLLLLLLLLMLLQLLLLLLLLYLVMLGTLLSMERVLPVLMLPTSQSHVLMVCLPSHLLVLPGSLHF